LRSVFPGAFPETARDQQGNERGVRRLTSSRDPCTRVLLRIGGVWELLSLCPLLWRTRCCSLLRRSMPGDLGLRGPELTMFLRG
jgi:hypothetical protein